MPRRRAGSAHSSPRLTAPPPWAGHPRSPSPLSAWSASAGWPRGPRRAAGRARPVTAPRPLVSASRQTPPPLPPHLPSVADGAAPPPPALAPRPLSGVMRGSGAGSAHRARSGRPTDRPSVLTGTGRGAEPSRARRCRPPGGGSALRSLTARPLPRSGSAAAAAALGASAAARRAPRPLLSGSFLTRFRFSPRCGAFGVKYVSAVSHRLRYPTPRMQRMTGSGWLCVR